MRQSAQTATAAAALVLACAWTMPATARADDPPVEPGPDPVIAPTEAGDQVLHNITYRARIDGVSRGALITYKLSDSQVQSENPTMVPGRVFEAQTVLDDANLAGMQVSVQWPYSANLHCEILVDDAIVAQADQFIKPRLTPADDDPDYGKLMCGAPLISAADMVSEPADGAPADSPAPVAGPEPDVPVA